MLLLNYYLLLFISLSTQSGKFWIHPPMFSSLTVELTTTPLVWPVLLRDCVSAVRLTYDVYCALASCIISL
jgi:hypothetical protein